MLVWLRRAALLATLGYLIHKLMRLRSPGKKALAHGKSKAPFSHGKLDMRRKAQLVSAEACDYKQVVLLAPNPDFDLDATIFASIQGILPRMVLQKKLGVHLHWKDSFIGEN